MRTPRGLVGETGGRETLRDADRRSVLGKVVEIAVNIVLSDFFEKCEKHLKKQTIRIIIEGELMQLYDIQKLKPLDERIDDNLND